jgi:hypothetical protein
VAAAVAAAYATAFGGGFQFDDWRVIVGDARVQSLSAWWASMPGIRPLLKLSYAANNASGLGLAGFHAVNVAVHAANAVLVLALLARMGRRLEPASPRGAALAGALFFALHPVQTEAVTYLSGRSSALAATFALASALAFAAGRDHARPGLVHGLSPLLLACALGVKEGALALPLSLLLLEAVDRRRRFSWQAAFRATAVHWLVLVLACGVYLADGRYRAMLGQSLALRPAGSNLLTHAQATGWLAGQLVRIHALVADPALEPVEGPTAGSVLAALAIAAAALAGLASLRKRPVAGFAVLWFLLWLAPQGWALPRREPASERQLYLALLGPAWLAGIGLVRWSGGLPGRRVAVASLLAGLGIATALRSRVYADEVRFWSDVVAKAPHNGRAHGNLGYARALACRGTEAEEAFARALALDPGDLRAAANLGLLREGSLLPAEAAARCEAGDGEARELPPERAIVR